MQNMVKNNADKKNTKDFRNKHRTDWQDFLWNEFLEKISATNSKDQIKEIFNSLISNYEKQMITRRIAALVLIKEGRSYKEINETLWISHATISALKKNILEKLGDYKSLRSLQKLKTNSNTTKSNKLIKKYQKSWLEEIFGDIDLWELIINPPPSGYSNMKERWKFLHRQ